MTTTTIVTAQSVGTSTNVGEGKFPQKTTAQALTDRFYVEAKVTNGAAAYDKSKRITMFMVASPTSVTAAAAVDLLRQTADRVDLRIDDKQGTQRATISSCIPLSGSYIYVWFDIPNQTVAQTLDVNLVEGP